MFSHSYQHTMPVNFFFPSNVIYSVHTENFLNGVVVKLWNGKGTTTCSVEHRADRVSKELFIEVLKFDHLKNQKHQEEKSKISDAIFLALIVQQLLALCKSLGA